MAFSVARVAGAGLRRAATPAVVSSSASGLFGKTCFRPSIRLSDVPFQKTENHFDGWNAEKLVWARVIIDAKLKQKGLAVISTGRDAREEAFVRNTSKELEQIRTEIRLMRNKKGDLASVNIGKLGSLNILSVLMFLLKIEEICPMIPVIQAWIEKLQG